jgi:tRNA(fMet)-specific endonuclease VapC
LSFHLDTNTVIGVLNGKPAAYRERYERIRASEDVFLSSVAVFELGYGLARSEHFEQNVATLRRFLGTLTDVLAFTDEDAVIAGEIRATLKKAGTPIGPYDLLIAAQAVRNNARLVTANTREFSRVPGLDWQDWTKD